MKPLHCFGRGALLALAGCSAGGLAMAENSQKVNVRGAVVNRAASGGEAVMNIGSNQGKVRIVGGNRQQVDISGAVVNAADAGARSELNIASRDRARAGNNQVVSVSGPVVTSASGRGVTSTVNIGDR
ncbi:MAG: hypothetical protein QM772_11585 [Ottowia sp.]|uniref:hypothetical protein n=1 Tax=Ottowia sp. TaxID=1898956 RepID=UPI0039E40FC5